MKKEEIVKSAKEIGFVSTFLFNSPYKYSGKEEMRWLFWMTEFSQWLRNTYSININIVHRPHNQKYHFFITGKWDDGNRGDLLNNFTKKYSSYSEALQEALTEIINLKLWQN